jgi:hypothetical protein
MSKVIFHRTVQKDMDGIYRHYLEESGSKLADRLHGDRKPGARQPAPLPSPETGKHLATSGN